MSIEKSIIQVAKKLKVNFTINKKPIVYEDAFSSTGVLPALVKRADQLCSLCLGYGVGASYEDSQEALLGTKVTFDEVTPNIIRILCITDVLYEIVKGSPNNDNVSLDELMYD